MAVDATNGMSATPEMIDAGAKIVFQIASCSPKGAKRWALKIYEAMVAKATGGPVQHLEPPVAAAELKRIADRLEEAAGYFRIWSAGRSGPAVKQSWWPDTILNTFEAFNSAEPERHARVVLYGPQIARMHEAMFWINWLHALDQRAYRIVWGRAQGVTWRTLEDRDGRSLGTIRKLYDEALAATARRLAVVPETQSAKITQGQKNALHNVRTTRYSDAKM